MSSPSKSENPVPLGNSQLRIGVYVTIDRPWLDHPFLRTRFLITSEKQLKDLMAMGAEGVSWVPALSDVEPTPPPVEGVDPAAPRSDDHKQMLVVARDIIGDATDEASEVNPAILQSKRREEKARRQRLLVAAARREWERAGGLVKGVFSSMATRPREAGQQLASLAASAVELLQSGEGMLQLMEKQQGESLQYHAINCMTMAALVGREMGLDDAQLRDLSLGALAHDIGKVMVQPYILKLAERSQPEEKAYRAHCDAGVELARSSGSFSDAALAIIRDHHEALDGSGFPARRRGDAISQMARIVGVVNRYDRLCGPESPDGVPMTPSDALRKLWREERNTRLDEKVLSALVKVLGVYPPGTIVELSDGNVALVVSTSSNPMRPRVLVHNPDVLKIDAEPIALEDAPKELTIRKALKPTDLRPGTMLWLSPRERLSCFFTVTPKG